jgi:hypothetical protein
MIQCPGLIVERPTRGLCVTNYKTGRIPAGAVVESRKRALQDLPALNKLERSLASRRGSTSPVAFVFAGWNLAHAELRIE